MCCALNSEVTFKDTLFGSLVTEAQGEEETETRKVKTSSGLRAGLKLVLDMHSNRASFGTISDTSNAFSVFIGGPTEFPVLREDKIVIEPGKEHFLKLSGQVSRTFKDGESKGFSFQVISTSGIRHLDPSSRQCFFKDEGDLELYSDYTYTNCRCLNLLEG